MTAATKKSLRPTFSENTSSEPTRISATNAVTTVATARAPSAARNDQPSISSSDETWRDAVAAKRVPGHRDVDDEEHDGDRRGDLRQRVRSGSPRPARGRRERGTAPSRMRSGRTRGSSSSDRVAPAAAGHERRAEHEQEVRDDASRQRAADDLGEPLVDGDERDDQLGRVAERRVEEAADPRARVLRGVLGRLPDQPRERDERERREEELERLRRVDEVVERDRDRRERERCEEDPCEPRAQDPTDAVPGTLDAATGVSPLPENPPLVKSCGGVAG